MKLLNFRAVTCLLLQVVLPAFSKEEQSGGRHVRGTATALSGAKQAVSARVGSNVLSTAAILTSTSAARSSASRPTLRGHEHADGELTLSTDADVSVKMFFDLNHRAFAGEYTDSFNVQWADGSGRLGTATSVGGRKASVEQDIEGVDMNTPGFRITATSDDAMFIDKLRVESGGVVLNGLDFERDNFGGYCLGTRTDRQNFQRRCWTEKTYQCIDFCANAQTIRVSDCGSATIQCRPECPVFTNYATTDAEIQTFLGAAKPCGHYANLNCPYEVIPAGVTHPGSGPGELEFIPYITQFDVGLHRVVNDVILAGADDAQKDKFIGASSDGETCLEIIVQANDSQHDATLAGCAGRCGPGCTGAGWAKDCLKHDVCVTYKNFLLMAEGKTEPFGFCNDLDCGDEAAQTVMNCFLERRGRDENIICDEQVFEDNDKAFGRWSFATNLFNEGQCDLYENWVSGQGIPDESQIRNSDFFDHLENGGGMQDTVV